MSLSLTWWEHDDGIRITDSLGDEVEALFGDEVESLRNHRAFGESFQVQCLILANFEHTNLEIQSWTANSYDVPLKDVLELLSTRRRLLRNVARKLEMRLAEAAGRVLDQTRLKSLSAKYAETLKDTSNNLSEPIMIQYLNFVLGRFDDEERLAPEFCLEQWDAFTDYFFSTPEP